ncbi:hypothetical protein TIFTF001_039671 [Ficus carica]|uniref:Uncharacterized protein n=1 Tax=Ficus carica TaxID=3494 RepID=A0AA88EAB9_FICCA|nr:hypothetical protein TIFTF001_039671 [Ficus carica]
MVRVLKETSPLVEDCGKEQDGKVLQWLGFSNPISLNNMDLVFGKDSFYVIVLLLCGVSSGPSATESWPSINQDISPIVAMC